MDNDRGLPDPRLVRAREKAAYNATRDNCRQRIHLTESGEYRVRPYGETVNPLWKFVENYPKGR